jgi:hypothetical protein
MATGYRFWILARQRAEPFGDGLQLVTNGARGRRVDSAQRHTPLSSPCACERDSHSPKNMIRVLAVIAILLTVLGGLIAAKPATRASAGGAQARPAMAQGQYAAVAAERPTKSAASEARSPHGRAGSGGIRRPSQAVDLLTRSVAKQQFSRAADPNVVAVGQILLADLARCCVPTISDPLQHSCRRRRRDRRVETAL